MNLNSKDIELSESRKIAQEQAEALQNQTKELKLQYVLNEYQNDVQLMFSVARFVQEVRDDIIDKHAAISKGFIENPEILTSKIDTATHPIIATALERIVELGTININQSVKLLSLFTSLLWRERLVYIKAELINIASFRAPQLLKDEKWNQKINSILGDDKD